jgi:hypothetical protein
MKCGDPMGYRGAETPCPGDHKLYNHEVKIPMTDGLREFMLDLCTASDWEGISRATPFFAKAANNVRN